MADKMWFGLPGEHMQFVPAPLIDSTVTRNRFVESIKFENGGGDVNRSSQYQLQYDFNLSGPAHELDGIDAFNRFASGFYGNGYIYLAHPTAYETNLFPAAWASPGLIEQGWKNIAGDKPIFYTTIANQRNQPKKTAVFNVTSDPGVFFKKATIVIPPTHDLHVGVSGSATGSAGVFVRPIAVNNVVGAPTAVTLLDAAADVRMNMVLSGAEYQAVDVYIARSTTDVSTIEVTSMMAQLYKTGRTVVPPTSHMSGEGSTGLVFADDAIVETYSYMYPPRKGISTKLVEVEAWRN